MSVKEFRAFVDRIEGDKAVLLLADKELETLVVPAKHLPEGASEGSVVMVSIAFDAAGTTEAAAKVRQMIRKLTGSTEK